MYLNVGQFKQRLITVCRRLKLSARGYLAAVLPGLADVVIQRLPELTLVAWATQYPIALRYSV